MDDETPKLTSIELYTMKKHIKNALPDFFPKEKSIVNLRKQDFESVLTCDWYKT